MFSNQLAAGKPMRVCRISLLFLDAAARVRPSIIQACVGSLGISAQIIHTVSAVTMEQDRPPPPPADHVPHHILACS